MFKKKEIPLKIEWFSAGEDSKFRIHSAKEILSVFRSIAQDGSRVVLYYDEGNDFIPTMLLGVDDDGLWLDIGAMAGSNQRILRSNKIIFISSHRQVKIQFVAQRIEIEDYDGSPAFRLPLPDSLLRIQRREYFRLTTPASNPLKCLIPPPPLDAENSGPKREMVIMDISGGGIALVCETNDAELQPGTIYENCQIMLPGIGAISTAIEVKNAFEVTLKNGQVNKRVGCEFIGLSGEAAVLLQRYITRLQSESMVKQ